MKVPRGGRHDADIDADLARAPYPDETLFGQYTQYPRLGRKGHVGDFIEIQGSAICGLEQAGPDEFAILLFPEQFLFETLRRNPGGVHGDERLVRSRAPAVQQASRDFLAGPCGPGNHHATARSCYALQCCPYRVDGRRIAGEFVANADAFTQPRIFAAQSLGFRGPRDQQQQSFGFERLLDEIHGATADRRHGGVDVAMPGEDDDGQFRFPGLDRVENFEAIHWATVQPYI